MFYWRAWNLMKSLWILSMGPSLGWFNKSSRLSQSFHLELINSILMFGNVVPIRSLIYSPVNMKRKHTFISFKFPPIRGSWRLLINLTNEAGHTLCDSWISQQKITSQTGLTAPAHQNGLRTASIKTGINWCRTLDDKIVQEKGSHASIGKCD